MTIVFFHCSLLCFPVKIANLNSVQWEVSPWFHCGSQQGAEHIARQKERGNMETFRKINVMDFVLLTLFWKDPFEVANNQCGCKHRGREAISLLLLLVLKLPGPHPKSSHPPCRPQNSFHRLLLWKCREKFERSPGLPGEVLALIRPSE